MLICTFESERENIKKRQAEGIAVAKLKGVVFGRPVKMPPDNFNMLVKEWEHGKLTLQEILIETSLTESTFYRRLRELRAKKIKK